MPGKPAAKGVARARGRGQRIYLRVVGGRLAIAAHRAALRVEVERVRVGRPLRVEGQVVSGMYPFAARVGVAGHIRNERAVCVNHYCVARRLCEVAQQRVANSR